MMPRVDLRSRLKSGDLHRHIPHACRSDHQPSEPVQSVDKPTTRFSWLYLASAAVPITSAEQHASACQHLAGLFANGKLCHEVMHRNKATTSGCMNISCKPQVVLHPLTRICLGVCDFGDDLNTDVTSATLCCQNRCSSGPFHVTRSHRQHGAPQC